MRENIESVIITVRLSETKTYTRKCSIANRFMVYLSALRGRSDQTLPRDIVLWSYLESRTDKYLGTRNSIKQ